MYKTLNLPADCIFAIGDLHGSMSALTNFVKSYQLQNAVIFCCGDIGLGFEKPAADKNEFNRLEKVLGEHNVHAVMLRGNHDDKRRFADGFYGRTWKHVHVVPDYTVVRIDGVEDADFHRVALCIGGAISIDRTRRQVQDRANLIKYLHWHRNATEETADLPKSYWPDEPAIYDEAILDEIIADNERLDIVCTHTAPTFCPPLTKGNIMGWLAQDATLEEDITNERNVMAKIYDKLVEGGRAPQYWTYGHFHFHATTEYDNTRFYLVDMVNERTNLPDAMELR